MPFKLTRCVFLVCVLVLCSMSAALAVKLEKLPIHQKEDRHYNWHTVKMGEAGYFLSERGLFSLGINAEGAATVRFIHATEEVPPSPFVYGGLSLIRAGSKLFYVDHFDYCGPMDADEIYKFELWKSDGTSTGTTLVKKFKCNYSDPFDAIIHLSGVGDSVYFHVRHANGSETGHGFKEQLWKADGLTNAVYMVTEFDEFGRMTEVVGLGDSAFFVFKGKLWKTDGSPRNMTRIVVPGVVEPSDYYYHRGNRLVMHDGKLYFSLLNKNKRELWLTDGSQAGTRLVKVIKPDGPYYSSDNFRFLASVGNFLYFQSDDNVHGTELWKTDGTPNGTAMLRDINPGSDFDSSFWESLAAPEMENSFFFAPPTVGAYLEDMGLWKTNGTSASTIFIKDPAQYPHTGNIKFGAIYNNEAYFYFSEYFDSSQVNRHELWKTDGTTAGTVKVKNFNREKINSASFFVLGDSLFFWAGGGYSTGSNYHLWRVTKGEATKVLPGSLHLLLHDDE